MTGTEYATGVLLGSLRVATKPTISVTTIWTILVAVGTIMGAILKVYADWIRLEDRVLALERTQVYFHGEAHPDKEAGNGR